MIRKVRVDTNRSSGDSDHNSMLIWVAAQAAWWHAHMHVGDRLLPVAQAYNAMITIN